MFKWFNKPQRDLEKVVDDVGQKIDEIIQERDALKDEVEHLKRRFERISEVIADEAFSIDFEIMRVFSMERNRKDDIPCTILGYFVKEGENDVVREWYLYCSEHRHQQLVEMFEAYKTMRVQQTKNVV